MNKNGWNYVLKENSKFSLPEEVLERYECIPEEYIKILQTFKQCVSPDDKIWFLCEDDYNNISSEYKWNEFEIIGLEAALADKDDDWEKDIKEWWDKHLPIIISVDEGYSFYAIDLSKNKGAIVFGVEPEFEDVENVAESLDDFIEKIVEGKILLNR